jgi:hypothetical protein
MTNYQEKSKEEYNSTRPLRDLLDLHGYSIDSRGNMIDRNGKPVSGLEIDVLETTPSTPDNSNKSKD